MFDEPTTLEKEHGRLMQALNASNPVLVREILSKTPQAVQPMPGWSQSPLQLLAGNMHSFACQDNKLACLTLLLEHGADPTQAHAYYPQPLQTLLDRGCIKAIEHMHEKGFLAKFANSSIKASTPGHFICGPNCWRDFGGDYPLDRMMKCFLDAGMDPTRNIYNGENNASVLGQLIVASVPRHYHRVPTTAEKTGLMLLEADTTTQITPSFLVQTFRSGHKQLFSALWERFNLQEHDRDLLDEVVIKFTLEEKAQFEAWLLDCPSNTPATSSMDGRKMRL